MTEDKTPGTAKILKEYFGYRPGDRLADFADELRKLSTEEKAQLVDGIVNETFTY